MSLRRIQGDGWLVLIGGGEFSFGETLEVDRAWLAKANARAKQSDGVRAWAHRMAASYAPYHLKEAKALVK